MYMYVSEYLYGVYRCGTGTWSILLVLGKNGVKWLWCRLLRDHGRDWYNRRV